MDVGGLGGLVRLGVLGSFLSEMNCVSFWRNAIQ